MLYAHSNELDQWLKSKIGSRQDEETAANCCSSGVRASLQRFLGNVLLAFGKVDKGSMPSWVAGIFV